MATVAATVPRRRKHVGEPLVDGDLVPSMPAVEGEAEAAHGHGQSWAAAAAEEGRIHGIQEHVAAALPLLRSVVEGDPILFPLPLFFLERDGVDAAEDMPPPAG